MAERHQPGFAVEVGRLQAGDKVDRLEGDVERLGQLALDGRDLAAAEGSREPANPDRHRVNRPPADELDDPVARLLEGQPGLDRRAVVLGELEGAGIAQEVRQVEQVDVERVALDPFAAVEQAPKRADLGIDRNAQRVLEGVDSGHLVGDRADAADAGDDVDDLVGRPTDDQPLEVAGRLEDLEMGLLDHAVADAQAERALALDPRQPGDVDGQVATRLGERVGVMHRWSPRERRQVQAVLRRHRSRRGTAPTRR